MLVVGAKCPLEPACKMGTHAGVCARQMPMGILTSAASVRARSIRIVVIGVAFTGTRAAVAADFVVLRNESARQRALIVVVLIIVRTMCIASLAIRLLGGRINVSLCPSFLFRLLLLSRWFAQRLLFVVSSANPGAIAVRAGAGLAFSVATILRARLVTRSVGIVRRRFLVRWQLVLYNFFHGLCSRCVVGTGHFAQLHRQCKSSRG